MSLQAKILHLKLNAALAVKHANGWQRLIDTHGLEQATAFYKHLGLNHLETKGFDYEGLTLSREPKEHEKISVKGIAQAQEASKEAITKILMGMRAELIKDGLKGIQKLSPASYHELILEIPPEALRDLRDRLIKVHRQGRLLVAAELGKKADPPDIDEFDDLDDLAGLTGSRVVNDVQSRLIAAMQRFTVAGLTGENLINSVTTEFTTGSVSYIDRTAAGVANRVIGIGRMDEMIERADEIDRYEQSALLDTNTCGPCAEDDGQTASDPADLPGGPNPDCLGSDFCRCFIVAIAD